MNDPFIGAPAPTGGSSIRATAFNLANNVIGAGFLGLPITFKEIGVVAGISLLILVCAMNFFSFWLLARACEATGGSTYMQIGTKAVGPRFGTASQVIAILYAFCSCISYVILVADFLMGETGMTDLAYAEWGTDVVDRFGAVAYCVLATAISGLTLKALLWIWQENAQPPWALGYTSLVALDSFLVVTLLCIVAPSTWRRQLGLLGFGMVGFLLLSLQRNLHPLKYLSGVSVLLTSFVAALCIHEAIFKPAGSVAATETATHALSHHGQVRDTTSWLSGFSVLGLMKAVPVVNVAFTAHYNAPRYFNELEHRSVPDFVRSLCLALGFSLLLYITVATTGYESFGAATQGDLLVNFSAGYWPAAATRVAFLFILFSDFPKVLNGVREGLLQLFFSGTTNNTAGLPLIIGITVVLVLAIIVIAVHIPLLQVILKFKGAVFGMPMTYILPAVIYLCSTRQRGSMDTLGCAFLIVWGGVFFLLGVITEI